MPIYTKKGDQGQSSTINGIKISKNSPIFEVLGTIDEANSSLGIAVSFLEDKILKDKITQVQKTLFKFASIIAGAKGVISSSIVAKMEKEIDEWTNQMPVLNKFIFPGGSRSSAFVFSARAVVRRLERSIVVLSTQYLVHSTELIYINRLSDYLFTLARYINFKNKIKETSWSR